MRRKSGSQPGFFNPRVCVAFILCFCGVCLTVFSFAAATTETINCAAVVPGSDTAGACADTDGDGFPDVEEINGYIDLNENGRQDRDDFVFPRQQQFIFSDVTHTGSGTGVLFPTVTDPAANVEPSNVLVTITSSGGLGTAMFSYQVNHRRPSALMKVHPVVDLTGNLRLMFYIQNFFAGDTYSYGVQMGPNRRVADPNVPNIYLQYDYMGWAEPGAPCTSDDDAQPEQPNLVCHEGHLNHSHYPGDPLFRKVVDQFAAHGTTLYIDPVHGAVPHAQVITFSRPDDGTNGATAACAGGDVIAGNIGPGQFAVNFHDIKYRPGSDFVSQPIRKDIYHYTVFSHFSTCLQDGEGNGSCRQCPTDRSTPSGQPIASAAGTAELPGNDFIVSIGDRWYVTGLPRSPFDEGGVFMHELGHNIGLHHEGDNAHHEFAPNYLSVMNNKYVFTGIQHAATPGSTVAVESLREINYSEHTLNTLDERHLDEQAGLSPLSAGYTGIVRFFTFPGGNGNGPESGPINWDGYPPQSCSSNLDCAFGPASLTGVYLSSGYCEVQSDLNNLVGISETMRGYSDWIHGPCASSPDCRINTIRQIIHDLVDPTVDPHEPCVRNRCQSLWLPFQNTYWGKAD